MVHVDSQAHLEHRVLLGLQVSLGNRACQVPTERKDPRAHEDLRGSQVSMDSPGDWVKKEIEERKGRGVHQDETVDYPDLQGLLDLQDGLFTSRQMIIMTFLGAKCPRVDLLLSRVGQDSQGQRDPRGREETQVLQDWPLKDRKENPASS